MPDVTNYTRLTGQPKTVAIAGQDVRVYKLSPSMLGELDAWLERHVPDPRLKIAELMKGQAPEVATHMWDRACDDAIGWPPTLVDPAGMKIFANSAKGRMELVFVALKKGISGFTRADAEAISERMDIDEFNTLLAAMLPESVEPPKDEVLPVTAAAPTTPAEANGSLIASPNL